MQIALIKTEELKTIENGSNLEKRLPLMFTFISWFSNLHMAHTERAGVEKLYLKY